MTAGRMLARLAAEGLLAHGWSNGPDERYARHLHDYDKVIVVIDGSIVFDLPALGQRMELQPGDRLELPAGTQHEALVGPGGVSCLEAHRPAGTLQAVPRRLRAEDW